MAGGDPKDQAGGENFLSHDQRYAEADEFLNIRQSPMVGETVDHRLGTLRLLHVSRVSAVVARMRSIKKSMALLNLLNPEKIIADS